MKVLLLDVERIVYKLVKPEASVYEESSEKKVDVRDAIAMMVSVEGGDDQSVADKALSDVAKFMGQLKRPRLVLYPFAHLSNKLADPKSAMRIIDYMYASASSNKGIEVRKAPFGWNKKLTLEMKGHPLAEQGKSYGIEDEPKTYKKAKPVSVNTAIVTKSIFSGLPETDHRSIGEKLDLFSFQEVSPGMVYWHRNGLTLFRQVMEFMRELENRYGYDEISTPSLANIALWHVSGHIDHYRNEMFVFSSESESLGMKPMNCPSSILIYKSRKWSYRELPFRTAIFDRLYRNEVSGALTGLFRVRELTQDDGHIFLREDQQESELAMLLKFVKEVYDAFGMKFKAKLSTMPDNHMGDEALWGKATEALKSALDINRIEYETKEKEGAFYGPKIDFDVIDSMGRSWQCATIQMDYQLPLRFELEYTGEDGRSHTPVIIHRAILGTLERFLGVLIEHYQGRFPTWLAPVQARVITISEQANEYANGVYRKLKDCGIRAYADLSDKTLEYKIREAQLQKIPYMIVIGKKEVEKKTLTIRDRDGKQKHDVPIDDFIGRITSEIKSRSQAVGI
ncbi:MAG: threonine--tRNA ligase [Candidatus Micrarchaeota archaeon]|nr:threonine--tRNA ligase [Candidatus Micrarchaeota archaeon]